MLNHSNNLFTKNFEYDLRTPINLDRLAELVSKLTLLFFWLKIAFFVIIILTRSVYMETTINLYQKLWQASDDLRSQMDANEYKNYLLGIILI